MPDHNFQPGDVLRCTSKYYAEQLNIAGDHGIVMGTKPHHIHVWFETLNRGFWIPFDILQNTEDIVVSKLIDRIRTIVYYLRAEEWELEETPELYRLICFVDEVTYETLVELRSYLDVTYISLKLAPEGMGRVIAQVEWAK
jgi:hypothetical protein